MPRSFKGSVQVDLLGNWDLAKLKLGLLKPVIAQTIVRSQRRVADKLRTKIRSHIRKQDLGWKSASLAKRGPLLMMESRAYYESIKVTQKNYNFTVGINKKFIEPRTGVPIYKVAIWQEYGNKRIPQRALWRPTIAEMGGGKGIAMELDRDLLAAMRIWGGNLFKVNRE